MKRQQRCCNPSTPYQDQKPLNCELPKGHTGRHGANTPDGRYIQWNWSRHQTCSFYTEIDSNTLKMTLQQLTKFEQLRIYHPLPWYLERCNTSGVCVKDCKGETVFEDDFGTIPDEMASGPREQIIAGATTLAHWLVAWSENPFGQ